VALACLFWRPDVVTLERVRGTEVATYTFHYAC
jgi:hypothetical protein